MNSSDWFDVVEFADGVIGIGEPGHHEDVKSFLVRGRDLSLLIDTGMGLGNIRSVVDSLVDTPVLAANTHSHWDHIGDNWRFDRIWIHGAEASALEMGVPNSRIRPWLADPFLSRSLPDTVDPETFEIRPSRAERFLFHGDVIDLGDRRLMVVETPGHSPGGISLFEEKTGILFVGDAVYAGPLFVHFDGSDPHTYRSTLETLANLVPNTSVVYPSHNAYPLEPVFITSVYEGFERIWSGRQPDKVEEGIEYFGFDTFSFTMREGWRDAIS